MAELIRTEVRTVHQLYDELCVAGDNLNGRLECHIMNDLDFNEEGFWYHPEGNFFNVDMSRNYASDRVPDHDYYLLDGGRYQTDPVTNQQILVGNNALTNIYTYPNCSVFSWSIRATNNYLTKVIIRNLDVEAVMNQSMLFSFPGAGVVQFENCNFNIKIVGFPNQDIAGFSAGSCAMFAQNTSTNSTPAYQNGLRFINCTFNVEIVTSPSNKIGYLMVSGGKAAYSGISCALALDACEIRIKNMTSDCHYGIFGTGISFQDSGGIGASVYYNNCAFFFNNYKEPGQSVDHLEYTLTNYNSNATANVFRLMNSFIAAFAETADGTIEPSLKSNVVLKRPTITTSFYDKNRINAIAYGTVSGDLYDLTTAECKSESKLREIGFLFATES